MPSSNTNPVNLLNTNLSATFGDALGTLDGLENLTAHSAVSTTRSGVHPPAVGPASSGGSLANHINLQFTCQQSGMQSAYDYYQEYHEGKNGCKSLARQYNEARQALKERRLHSDDKRSTGKYTMKSIKNNTTYSRRSTFVNKMDKYIQDKKELGQSVSPQTLANRIDRYAEHHKRTVADLVRNPGWDEQVVFNYLD